MEPDGVPPGLSSEARAGGMTSGGIRCTVWFGMFAVGYMVNAYTKILPLGVIATQPLLRPVSDRGL